MRRIPWYKNLQINPATCVLCKGDHPANYKGCTVYRNLVNIRYKNNGNPTSRQNPIIIHTPQLPDQQQNIHHSYRKIWAFSYGNFRAVSNNNKAAVRIRLFNYAILEREFMSIIMCTYTNRSDEITEHEMGGACSWHRRQANCEISLGKPNRRRWLVRRTLRWRIILKRILKKLVSVCTGVSWLRTG
jgi:hypothetical protein